MHGRKKINTRTNSYKKAMKNPIMSKTKIQRPTISAKKKESILKTIRTPSSSTNLNKLFTKLDIKTLKSMDIAKAKSLLKKKDIDLITHALTNNNDETLRPDQRTLISMILLGSMGNYNYSPASLYTHGGRIIFDCRNSRLADLKSVMFQQSTDQTISPFIKGQTQDGITTRKTTKWVAGGTVSSHSLVFDKKKGLLKERKHNVVGSSYNGKSSPDPASATLFQQNLGLKTGTQSGKEGSLILVTDKYKKNFMIGIEGASFGFGGSHITKKGHSCFGFRNKVSAFNQEKGSAIKKLPGFNDFPGKINQSRITLSDSQFSDFKIIDQWLPKQSSDVRMQVLTQLMNHDHSVQRHTFIKMLIKRIINPITKISAV